MEGNVGWACVELCLVEAVFPRGDRPPCRIPDHPQATGVVRKFMGSLKPSSSGKFLWKYFLYIVLHFPISQKGGETKDLKCIALWGTKSRNCEPV